MFSLLYGHTDDSIFDDFAKISIHFPEIAEDIQPPSGDCRRFPTTFQRFPKIFQNCSKGQMNIPEHFLKISEDFQRLPKTFAEDLKMF